MEFAIKKKNEKTKIDNITIGQNKNLIVKIEPLDFITKKIIKNLKMSKSKLIFLSPQGKKINQNSIKHMSIKKELILICGKNKGLDERFVKFFVYKEISIGDYIVSNGNVALLVLMNAINRFKRNLKILTALKQNTFENNMFDYPSYTKPIVFKKFSVPNILIYGNHGEINVWKKMYSRKKTWLYRPDLIKKR